MRVTIQIFNADIETLENRKSRCHSLCYQTSGCVTNFNYSHNINVLYPTKSVSKFSIVFHFYLTKGSYCKGKYINELLFICGVCTKRYINISKLSIWGPLLYQFRDVISLIDTENNSRPENPKIQVLKDRSFLQFNLKIFFKTRISSVKNVSLLLVLRTSPV